jgi:hypothetical protein
MVFHLAALSQRMVLEVLEEFPALRRSAAAIQYEGQCKKQEYDNAYDHGYRIQFHFDGGVDGSIRVPW